MSESSRFTQRCRSESCSGGRCPRSGRGRAGRSAAWRWRGPALTSRTCHIHSTMSSTPPWLPGARCGTRTGRRSPYRRAIRLESARSGDNEFRDLGVRLAARPRSYTSAVFATLAVLDFLNSREKALVVWLVAIFAFAALKSGDLGSSFLGVLRVLCSSKLLLLFGSAALYSAALVVLGRELGLWHTSAIKATIYWFFGTGGDPGGECDSGLPRGPSLRQEATAGRPQADDPRRVSLQPVRVSARGCASARAPDSSVHRDESRRRVRGCHDTSSLRHPRASRDH